MRNFIKMGIGFSLLAISSIVFAAPGPLILGGDDLDDHGNRVGAVNVAGWAYAESAAVSIITQVTLTGPPSTHDIVAIGPTDPGGTYNNGNSGGMVASVANIQGYSVLYVDSAAAINTLFTNLANNSVRPKMIWIVSNQASNDLDPAEEAALATHGAGLKTFQQGGGGILSQVHGYGWLTSILSGIVINQRTCGNPVTLTAAGNTAFPGLTNAQVDAGPCHATFSGNLGGLGILATDVNNLNVIIGGAVGVVITPPPLAPTDIPTLSFWGLFLMSGLLGLIGRRGLTGRRKK